MASSKDERQALTDFGQRYAIATSDVLRDMERDVIGAVWGANGFTTVAQADLLAERVELTKEDRLLDIGTGRGWPGLYLAKQTRCEVVLCDLPIEGLRLAHGRAQEENVRMWGSVVCSARYLPFAPGSFDAIVHTDVLC